MYSDENVINLHTVKQKITCSCLIYWDADAEICEGHVCLSLFIRQNYTIRLHRDMQNMQSY